MAFANDEVCDLDRRSRAVHGVRCRAPPRRRRARGKVPTHHSSTRLRVHTRHSHDAIESDRGANVIRTFVVNEPKGEDIKGGEFNHGDGGDGGADGAHQRAREGD